MSSPRWERAEVDNLETISQIKKNRGGEKNSQQHTHRPGETKRSSARRATTTTEEEKQIVGGIDIPELEKQQKITKWFLEMRCRAC
jgi:hypothetical protein